MMKRDCLFACCALLVLSCSRENKLAFFEKSQWRDPVHCIEKPPLNDGTVVADLIPIGDTAFAALYGDERELISYNRALSAIHTVRFDELGPRGVRHPVSAAITDTLLFVADDANGFIKRFNRHGEERGSVKLSFIPRKVRVTNNRLLVTPLVAGSNPAHLLFEVQDNKTHALGAPIAQYEDIGINTMANMASLAGFGTRVVLLHEMVVPFGYVFDLGSAREFVQRFPVPLPDAVRTSVGRLPQPPLTDKNVNDLTVVAFVAASSVVQGRTYYVTRLGDGRRAPYRKLLVELDSAMQLRAVHPIDVNPHHLVFVSEPAALIAVDAANNWFECPLR